MPIDKPTPNVSETVIEVPKQEELIQERDEIIEKKNQQGNVEVTMDEEGGAEIAFDPRAEFKKFTASLLTPTTKSPIARRPNAIIIIK